MYDNQILAKINRGYGNIGSLRSMPVRPIESTFVDFLGSDPVAFVISLNLRCRHLNECQRAMVAAKLANLAEGRPKSTPSAPLLGETAQISTVSQSDAADMMNVSRGSVRNAATVQRAGIPELRREFEAGAVKVSTAATIARQDEGT